jgi:hypothetical protein
MTMTTWASMITWQRANDYYNILYDQQHDNMTTWASIHSVQHDSRSNPWRHEQHEQAWNNGQLLAWQHDEAWTSMTTHDSDGLAKTVYEQRWPSDQHGVAMTSDYYNMRSPSSRQRATWQHDNMTMPTNYESAWQSMTTWNNDKLIRSMKQTW